MKILKHSIINMIFIIIMSTVYSFLFIFTSDHIEFLRLTSKSKTLQSDFWNGWSAFIREGNMKYLGYIIIGLTMVILLLMVFKRMKKYDEYQVSILSRSLIIAGVLSIIIIPIIIILILSDPNYAIETIFLFSVIQWFSVLISDLIYVINS